jgi:hypothetical protein
LEAVFAGAAMLLDEEVAGAGVMAFESVLLTWDAGTMGEPEFVSAVAAFDFLLFFVLVVAVVVSLAADLSVAAGVEALSAVVSFDFLLFFVEVVAAVVSLAADLSAAAGVEALSAVVSFDFLLFFVEVVAAVVSLAADLSVAAEVEVLSAAAAFDFLFFFVEAVVSLADDLSAVAVWSSAVFLAFFLDFFVEVAVVVVSVLAVLELACAFAKAGEMTTESIRQKQDIQRISLFWERFIFPRRIKRHQAPFLRSIALRSGEKTGAPKCPSMITPKRPTVN